MQEKSDQKPFQFLRNDQPKFENRAEKLRILHTEFTSKIYPCFKKFIKFGFKMVTDTIFLSKLRKHAQSLINECYKIASSVFRQYILQSFLLLNHETDKINLLSAKVLEICQIS